MITQLSGVSDAHLISDIIALATVLVTVTAFAFKIKNIAEKTADALKFGMDSAVAKLNDHEDRIRDIERFIPWDGDERRRNPR